jgi:hypothetical protein
MIAFPIAVRSTVTLPLFRSRSATCPTFPMLNEFHERITDPSLSRTSPSSALCLTCPAHLCSPPDPPVSFPASLSVSLSLSFRPLDLAPYICLVPRVGFRFRASLPILGTSWRSALRNQVDPFFSLVLFRVSAVSRAGAETGREFIPTPVEPILISTTIPRPYPDREGCTGTYSHTHSEQTHPNNKTSMDAKIQYEIDL